ncbi:DUF4349 domain-containing protein [Demequina sediminicola]|uniref:DUF4349 domain-containing protein n=1 Tax=Demequina sediminicola TaxID=1095026 RepID=UPI000784442B|nr:DUF4349 domain-containing protein [Demequina sediminicola]
MDTFTPTHSFPAPQRQLIRLRAGVLGAVLILAALLMTGCSASSEDSSSAYSGQDDALVDREALTTEESMADASGGGDIGIEQTESVVDDRSVIVTGSMFMTVDDPVAVADDAAAIVTDAGGRIDGRSETAPTDYDGGSAWMTLRIPSDQLDAVVDDLRALGSVDEFNTHTLDVTREVTDLDAEISTLTASTDRIEALLDQAEDIEDIIALESELDSRRSELESLEARQRGLSDQVSMSTVDLSLTTEPAVLVDDSPSTFLGGIETGWNALTGFASAALVSLGVLLPWLAVLGIVAAAVIVLVRRRRVKRTHTA